MKIVIAVILLAMLLIVPKYKAQEKAHTEEEYQLLKKQEDFLFRESGWKTYLIGTLQECTCINEGTVPSNCDKKFERLHEDQVKIEAERKQLWP